MFTRLLYSKCVLRISSVYFMSSTNVRIRLWIFRTCNAHILKSTVNFFWHFFLSQKRSFAASSCPLHEDPRRTITYACDASACTHDQVAHPNYLNDNNNNNNVYKIIWQTAASPSRHPSPRAPACRHIRQRRQANSAECIHAQVLSQPPNPTQPPTLCGTGDEYRPIWAKVRWCSAAGIKDRIAHSICG